MNPEHGPLEEPDRESRSLSYTRILWQLSVFLIGFLSLLALHGVFTHLIDELAEQTEQERARLFVGEQVARDIRLVESGVYRMATTLGIQGQQKVKGEIHQLIAGIRSNLEVLREGGVARQTIQLNLEGRDQMINEVVYDLAHHRDQGYVLEIIDLTPKLDEIERKTEDLSQLLRERARLRDTPDQDTLLALEKRIKIFLKKLPPLFTRLTENANRMFFESHQRLEEIENRIASRTSSYRLNELIMVGVIIVSVMILGLVFARQIQRSNKQLADAHDRMRAAKEEAERANRAKSDFLSRMSHELRTPMNAILGFSQLLAIDEELDDDQKESVAEIEKAGRHLLELINEVLDLAKIEAGRLELEDIEFSVAAIADEIVGIMSAKAQDKGLELHAFVSPRLPETLFGDPTRLKQVILNLLGNAIKFTEQGDVGLHIDLEPDAGRIRFRISDTGVGFDEDTRQHLFRPFTQADESITRQYGGTGLGLVICKELVEAMGGQIDARSTAGEGSVFWFDLPVEGDLQPSMPPDPRFEAMPVLVVDGHAAVRHGLESYLAALGAEPLSAVDADEALALLRRRLISHQPCRLVLADAELPDNGADRLPAAIAGDPQLGKPMLALLKPAGQSADIESENQYPLTVAKPVSLDKLMQALEQTLEHPPASEEEPDTPSDALLASPTVPDDVEVLLVEDQAANRRVAQRMLQRMGIQVICAENGREAVQMFQQHRFSLIFMDMQMPEMDGLEATRRIRELEQRHDGSPSHTPIIAMTANAMESDRHTCLHAGMDDHLPKPISFEQVEEQLERWISDYSPSQGA